MKAIRFRDSIGRLNRNASPAATLENVVEVVLLLTGEVVKNRQRQERLAQTDPGHAARAFGESVETSAPPTATTNLEVSQKQLVRRISESLVQTVSRTILDVFAEKFQELAKRMMDAQTEWQTHTLASLREIRRPEAAPAMTDGADQEVIDVDECAPTGSDGRGRSQIKVSDFMRANWRDEWAGVNVKSYLLKFSLLLKPRATQTASGPKY